jgi:hypothetical protein
MIVSDVSSNNGLVSNDTNFFVCRPETSAKVKIGVNPPYGRVSEKAAALGGASIK